MEKEKGHANEIIAQGTPVVFGQYGAECLDAYLSENKDNISKVIVLMDEHTHEGCLPTLLDLVEGLDDLEILEIESGEQNKNLDTCRNLWEALTEIGADRKSLLINLGGGVITDMGGFVAGCFMRGIRFINIPTTLLSQVDASVGGKTGVDLGMLKNLVGLFVMPQMVWIDARFLASLDQRQMLSGMAEMIKHGLIYNRKHWEDISSHKDFSLEEIERLVFESVSIKNEVVNIDWKEAGLRKILNFGHTIGHAVETYFLENKNKTSLLHGEAVAVGMVCEAWLSAKLSNLPMDFAKDFREYIRGIYPIAEITENDIAPIMEAMKHDKKNESGKINFSLLTAVGECSYDNFVELNLIEQAIKFYHSPSTSKSI